MRSHLPYDCQVIGMVIVIIVILLLTGISGLHAQLNDEGPRIRDKNFTATPLLKGLSFPSAMTFIGPNDLLILEKNSGNLLRITDGHSEVLLRANVSSAGERGLVGVAAKNQSHGAVDIFLYFTESNKTGDRSNNVINKLYKYELSNNTISNGTSILSIRNPAYPFHNGGAITIGPDDMLYVPVGDMGRNDSLTQNIPHGKFPDGRGGIMRITPDGEAAGFFEAHPFYYAYGIRNSFGLDFDPLTNKLWDTENGPAFGDEVNLVQPGFNSGWSQVSGKWRMAQYVPPLGMELPAGKNFTTPNLLVSLDGKGQYSDPELSWLRPAGLTAIKFLSSDKYGQSYKNDVLVGDFFGRIYHLELNKNRTSLILNDSLVDKVVDNSEQNEQIIFGDQFGGITDIDIGPDGYIYVLSSSLMSPESDSKEGILYRIVPVKND